MTTTCDERSCGIGCRALKMKIPFQKILTLRYRLSTQKLLLLKQNLLCHQKNILKVFPVLNVYL